MAPSYQAIMDPLDLEDLLRRGLAQRIEDDAKHIRLHRSLQVWNAPPRYLDVNLVPQALDADDAWVVIPNNIGSSTYFRYVGLGVRKARAAARRYRQTSADPLRGPSTRAVVTAYLDGVRGAARR